MEENAEASRKNWLRSLVLWIFAALAALAFSTYVAVRWVERQVLTTENWVELVSPLPKQKVVSDALGNTISQKVVDKENIEARITEALPPRADFLAGPLAGQVSSLMTRAAQQLVATDGFQAVWEGANRVAMNRLLAKARGEDTPLQAAVNERFNIDISQVGGQLRGGLGKLGDAIPALQPGSERAIGITADLQSKPRRVHQVIRTTDTLYAVLPWVAAAAFLTALAVAIRRRLAVMWIATAAIVLLLVELIAVRWLRGFTLDKVRIPENLPAVTYIFDTVTAGLRNMFINALILLLLVIVLCWLAGPGKWPAWLRSHIPLDRLRAGSVGKWWQQARSWAARYKYYIWLAIVLLVLACLALIEQVSGNMVINAIMLAVASAAAVHIIATPRVRPA